jgi:hypothetical protein
LTRHSAEQLQDQDLPNRTSLTTAKQYRVAMPNPATTLANLLKSWSITERGTLVKARGGKSENDLDFWRSQVQAVELLAEVDRSIDALEAMAKDVHHMREDLAPLYKAVFGYKPAWRGPGQGHSAGPAAPPESIRSLLTLGVMIDSFLGHAFSAEAEGQLLELLDEATNLVNALDVDERTKFYLFDLVANARRAVKEIELFGAARARSTYMALTTELKGQAVVASAQRKNSVLNRTIFTWVAAAGLAIAKAFGTGIGDEAADWIISQAPSMQEISPPGAPDVTDAEVIDDDDGGTS